MTREHPGLALVRQRLGGDLLKTGEVARLFGVNPKTVWAWATKGRLSSVRTPGGQHRYRAADVARLFAAAGGRS